MKPTDYAPAQLYMKAIEFLQQVKLTQGNTALNSTLRRHATLRKFLLKVQADRLNWLEETLDNWNLVF